MPDEQEIENREYDAATQAERVELVGTSTVGGTVTATQGTKNAAAAASWPIQGADAEDAAITGAPVLVGGADADDGGNVHAFRADTDGAQLVFQRTGATNTRTSVSGSASSVTVLALNTGRRGAIFYNDSTAILYLDLTGGTATTANYSVQIPSQGYFELPVPLYTGLITGIWAAANGAVKVTELSV